MHSNDKLSKEFSILPGPPHLHVQPGRLGVHLEGEVGLLQSDQFCCATTHGGDTYRLSRVDVAVFGPLFSRMVKLDVCPTRACQSVSVCPIVLVPILNLEPARVGARRQRTCPARRSRGPARAQHAAPQHDGFGAGPHMAQLNALQSEAPYTWAAPVTTRHGASVAVERSSDRIRKRWRIRWRSGRRR